jgi:serine/threonine-protein kinase
MRQTAEVFSDSINPGHIVSQNPEAGEEVERNSLVQVEVSKGPDVVFFPDVEGMPFSQAKEVLEQEGFVIGSVLGTTEGNVVSTSVDGSTADAGEIYRRGTAVDVVSL